MLALEALAGRLAASERVPLLVVRVPALERTAWRRGLRAARSIERRVAEAFGNAARSVLRGDDCTGHDRGTDIFVAALTAPTRAGHCGPAPIDIRSALARIAARVAASTSLEVDTGWTTYDARPQPDIAGAIERALVRGAQERERYAFFSAVGHELRTPLASICGYLETLANDAGDAATRRRFVRIAHAEALRLTRLLDGMFEISLLDLSAADPPQAGRLDLALPAAADACAAQATRCGVQLRVALPAATVVGIDGERLTLVLINLIDNAIKHGRRGGCVDVRTERASPRALTVTIDDDGPGIPTAERERIFALGERGPTAAPGSGIGLALVRLVVERAGGRVEIRDGPRGGACFAVTLPSG